MITDDNMSIMSFKIAGMGLAIWLKHRLASLNHISKVEEIPNYS